MKHALKSLRAATRERVLGSAIAKRIVAGRANRDEYVRYLLDVHGYAQHSPRVIALAGSRCSQTLPAIAPYLFRHAAEELGHEVWAREDLLKLGVDREVLRVSRPGPSCMAMIGLEYYAAGVGNPVSLFGWMYVLESLGDDIAHAIAASVSSALPGESSQAVGFLKGHGDADHDHAREIAEQIEAHVARPEDQEELVHVARLSSEYYVRMLEEAATPGERS